MRLLGLEKVTTECTLRRGPHGGLSRTPVPNPSVWVCAVLLCSVMAPSGPTLSPALVLSTWSLGFVWPPGLLLGGRRPLFCVEPRHWLLPCFRTKVLIAKSSWVSGRCPRNYDQRAKSRVAVSNQLNSVLVLVRVVWCLSNRTIGRRREVGLVV